MSLDDIAFHDSIFNEVSISLVQRTCRIGLRLGDWDVGKDRTVCEFFFKEMVSVFGRFDFIDLAENAWAGNVQDGYVDATDSRLRMHLTGGTLEAVAESILLSQIAPIGAVSACPGAEGLEASFRSIEAVDLDFSHLELIEISPVTSTCRLGIQVRTSTNLSERAMATLIFESVSSCIAHLDVTKLSGEHRFGNVVGGHVDAEQGRVRLYLRDGFIEILGRAASLVWT
ncbi:hypothetical protein [Stenotrophomonas sp. PS02289]|uniref:hypothetical protein n=1 Tax=Stenotrophomonas sp. PS02289 TaxID=2991422 RepID=UPI00249A515B|nr:hypothetical protein [Stenotrophomonas sp. PS02289]